MESDSPIVTLAILMALVILFAITFLTFSYITSKYRLKEKITSLNSGSSTKKIDIGEEEKTCEICLGKIGDESVAACGCGRIYHDACARPTGSCPYCSASYESMDVRDPVRNRCPVCGRYVKGNICACGAVIPRNDGTFICSCGNTIDDRKPVCNKCGAIYEKVTMKLQRPKI